MTENEHNRLEGFYNKIYAKVLELPLCSKRRELEVYLNDLSQYLFDDVKIKVKYQYYIFDITDFKGDVQQVRLRGQKPFLKEDALKYMNDKHKDCKVEFIREGVK